MKVPGICNKRSCTSEGTYPYRVFAAFRVLDALRDSAKTWLQARCAHGHHPMPQWSHPAPENTLQYA